MNDTPGHPAPLVLIGESQPSRPVPGCTFVQDGRSATTESAPLAAMTRPARTRDGHEPASGWQLSCTGASSAASPLTRARPVAPRGGKEAMSYQPPPDYEADTAAGNPPGWYLDPIGLRSLRWWDGAQWARHTQPLLGPTWERPSPSPDAIASASGGYGAVRQPGARRRRQQDGPQGGAGDAPGLAPESFPPVRTQAQPDPGQPQDPQGSPDQQPRLPGPPSPAHHASRQRRNRKARGALTGLGALIGSSSPSARRTRTARHRQQT